MSAGSIHVQTYGPRRGLQASFIPAANSVPGDMLETMAAHAIVHEVVARLRRGDTTCRSQPVSARSLSGLTLSATSSRFLSLSGLRSTLGVVESNPILAAADI